MRRRVALTDLGVAALIAAAMVILTPGLAVVAIIAIFVVLACAASLAVEARRGIRRKGRNR